MLDETLMQGFTQRNRQVADNKLLHNRECNLPLLFSFLYQLQYQYPRMQQRAVYYTELLGLRQNFL